VEEIHDHASGLDAAALIGSTYRNLHNLFDKRSRVKIANAPEFTRKFYFRYRKLTKLAVLRAIRS
jgi:hypothetical protein